MFFAPEPNKVELKVIGTVTVTMFPATEDVHPGRTEHRPAVTGCPGPTLTKPPESVTNPIPPENQTTWHGFSPTMFSSIRICSEEMAPPPEVWVPLKVKVPFPLPLAGVAVPAATPARVGAPGT